MPHAAGLWYESRGAGPPVMLLSGLSGVARGWAPQIEPLSRHFRVVVHDHRGTGASGAQAGDVSVEAMAEDVVALMDALGIERAHLLGHSTGGAMALALALHRPARVGRIVVSSAWAAPDPDFLSGFQARLQALRLRGKAAYLRLSTEMTFGTEWTNTNREAVEARIARDLAEPPDEALLARRIAAICRFDLARALPQIAVPVLAIYAGDDRVVPWRATQAIADAVPGARIRAFAQGGHALPVLQAVDYAKAVVDFLAEAQAVPASFERAAI
jgi:aminoacrylate hydrolase